MNKKIRHKYLQSLGLNELQIHGQLESNDLDEVFSKDFESIWIPGGDASLLGEVTSELQHVKAIRYCPYESQDISWINKLTNLEVICLEGPMRGIVEFDNFKFAKEVDVDLCKSTNSILTSSISPEFLGLKKLKNDLTDLPLSLLKNLRGLSLRSSSICSLDGLSNFSKLTYLNLERCMKLTNINALTHCQKLEHLDIGSCNSVESYEALKSLIYLREFHFNNKELPSLSLLPKETVEVVILGEQTKILDENVETLFEFPNLKRAVFRKKKGYKYSAIEIDEMMSLSKE